MGMKGSSRQRDIVIPKGVVIAYPISGGVVLSEGIHLGYCQEAKLTISEETRQVYTAQDGSKSMIIDRVTKTDYSLPLELVSVNAQNLALLSRGSQGLEVQTGGSYSTPLDVVAPAALDRTKKLGKRGLSIKRIDFDGGTVAFTVGSTLSTGASSAEIAWKTGDAASGSLFVVGLTGAEFINDAVLADNGGTPGAAVQNGAVVEIEDIVLTDSGGTERYVLEADYDLDPKSGTVFFREDGNIAASEELKAYFDYGSLSETVIKPGVTGATYYEVHVLPFGETSQNNFEVILFKCSIKADAEMPLVTAADEEISLAITLTPLTTGPHATSEYPVYKIVQHTGT